ncbi:MAG: hypothetical protein RDV48_25755 [Candidatus Eremiobacteraeota bacterium]|nr:hypothetical protein [Candidatus Eremiobacteraeota bacterium]
MAEQVSKTNREYRKITGLSDEGALLDLKDLMHRSLIVQVGSGRKSHYILKQVGDLGD